MIEMTSVHRQSDTELAALAPTISRLRYAAPNPFRLSSCGHCVKNRFVCRQITGRHGMPGRAAALFAAAILCNNYHRYGNLGKRTLD